MKTRIAYIMSRFPKISETFVLYEILELQKLGLEIEVFPLIRETTSTLHPEAQALVEKAHYLPFLSPKIIRSNLRVFYRDPKRYCTAWKTALSRTWGSLNFFVGALGILPKVIRFADRMQELKIQHVHATFSNHPALAAYIISSLIKIPFSFAAHGSDLHKDQTMLKEKVEAASFVVPISQYNRRFILKHCGNQLAEKIQVVHCGIDSAVFTPSQSRPKNQVLQIISVARFEEVKGHRFLIEACELLHQKGIKFTCLLAGDGPLRKELQEQVRKSNLDQNVKFLGALTRPQIAHLLQSADVFVLASVPTSEGKREGIPVVLMEAMACQVPVISSALSGIPELVVPDENGFLTEPKDSESLAAYLTELAMDPELRSRLGFSARKKVVSEFDLTKNSRLLIQLFLKSTESASKG